MSPANPPRPPAQLWWLGAAAVVAVLALVLHGAALFSPTLMTDEAYYAAAVQAVAAGRSPSEVPGWLYPVPTAHTLAWVGGRVGLLPMIGALRLLNGLGMVGVFALAGGVVANGLRRPWAAPVVAGLTFLLWRTTVLFEMGNVSGALFLPILAALFLRRAPARSMALAIGAVFKPYALGLALTRPWREAVGPVALMGAMVLLSPISAEGLSAPLGPLTHGLNQSPYRGLVAMLHIPWPLVFAVLAGFALTWARGAWGRGLCLTWAILPIAWGHTSALLLVPLAFAIRRWLVEAPGTRRTAALAALVLCAIVLRGLPMWQLMAGLPLAPTTKALVIAELPGAAVVVLALLVADPPWLPARQAT